MKEFHKQLSLSNLLFLSLTSVAKNSASICPHHLWQEPKVPKCLLDKEIEKAKNSN